MSGLDIDTRSDIYSLGVLLYELLTGTTPFDKERLKQAAYDEMRRIIREEEPPKPSTRLSRVRSAERGVRNAKITPHSELRIPNLQELDWIVMKALEKDRTRRYETANGFAADVLHYLADEPVLACPPSTAYRFRKFARRNKVALLTTSVLAAVLVLGTGISTWQAIRATKAETLAQSSLVKEAAARVEADEQRQKALANFNDAQVQRAVAEANFAKARAAVDNYFTQVSESHLLKAAGMQPLRRDLLQAALTFYEDLAKQRSEDPGLRVELAAAHYRVGRIYAELGTSDEATKSYNKARELYKELLQSEPDDVDLKHGLARVHYWQGTTKEAIDLWENSAERAPGRTDIRRELAEGYNWMGLTVTNFRKARRGAPVA